MSETQARRPVADNLFAEPWQFEFFQAVRLLEILYPERSAPGEGADPDSEAVRLRSAVSFVFPASEVSAVAAPPDGDSPAQLTANLLGAGGARGPLPDADSDRVIERAWRKDFAMRDFLDIFHHRLLSLLVQSRKAYHPTYTGGPPQGTPIAAYAYALLGLGLPELRNRLRLSDRALLHYSGILARHPRSAIGLERLLADYFQTPVQVVQMCGRWLELDPEEWTVIGRGGRNRALGDGAHLGTAVWDQQGRFEVVLGPMNLGAFFDLLPLGSGYGPLCELTRFYAGPDQDFGFRLMLRAAEVPVAQLGSCRLGWTSWLKTRPFDRDDSQVRLSPRTLGD
jgi:type VI secretion system protein ImpH